MRGEPTAKGWVGLMLPVDSAALYGPERPSLRPGWLGRVSCDHMKPAVMAWPGVLAVLPVPTNPLSSSPSPFERPPTCRPTHRPLPTALSLPPQDRHMLIEREVAAPRGVDSRWMTQLVAGRSPLVYNYGAVGGGGWGGVRGRARISWCTRTSTSTHALALTHTHTHTHSHTHRSPLASAARTSTSCTAGRSCCEFSSPSCATRATASSCRRALEGVAAERAVLGAGFA